MEPSSNRLHRWSRKHHTRETLWQTHQHSLPANLKTIPSISEFKLIVYVLNCSSGIWTYKQISYSVFDNFNMCKYILFCGLIYQSRSRWLYSVMLIKRCACVCQIGIILRDHTECDLNQWKQMLYIWPYWIFQVITCTFSYWLRPCAYVHGKRSLNPQSLRKSMSKLIWIKNNFQPGFWLITSTAAIQSEAAL